MLCLTRRDSNAMCPGNDIIVFLLELVAVVETQFFEVRNTPWKWAMPTHSRLIALWHYFTRQSMLQMRRLVLDTFLMRATISVVRIP